MIRFAWGSDKVPRPPAKDPDGREVASPAPGLRGHKFSGVSQKKRQDARCGVGRPAKLPVGIPGRRRLARRILSVLNDRFRRGIPGQRLLARRLLSVHTRRPINAEAGGWFRTNLQVSPDCQDPTALNQRCALSPQHGGKDADLATCWRELQASEAFALAIFLPSRQPGADRQSLSLGAAPSCAFNFCSDFRWPSWLTVSRVSEAFLQDRRGQDRSFPKNAASAWKGLTVMSRGSTPAGTHRGPC